MLRVSFKLPAKPIALPVAAVTLVLIAAADALTGNQISLAVLYVPPIMLASWTGGLRWGLGVSAAAVALLLVVGHLTGHPFEHAGFFVASVVGEAGTYALVAWLVSRLARALAYERSMARTDPLTGLHNRAVLYHAIEHEIARQRRRRYPLSLVYLDCDDFKAVNDAQGHLAGDAVLKAVAQTLQASLRCTDCTARLGGDEFAVLMPDTGAEEAAHAVAHFRSALRARMRTGGWPVDFSIGLATFAQAPASPEAALQAADELMYLAKGRGKGQVACGRFPPETPFAATPTASVRPDLAQDLARGLP